MEIRILRYFLTIAEEKSITQAAKVLHITQPTLSRQLRELEEQLETDLFIRKNKKMFLTEAGMYLKSRAEEIILLNDKTEQEFQSKSQEFLSGHISIGSVEAENSDTLAMFLEEMLVEHPQVTFNIYSSTGDNILERLDKGLLDVALLSEPISIQKYEKIVLPKQERWGLLVSKDSFLASKSQISSEELVGLPIISPFRLDVKKMFDTWSGLEEKLTIIGTYNLIFNVFSLVEHDVGLALIMEGAASNRQPDTLKFLPLIPEIKTNCVLAWRKNTILSPTTNVFIEKIKYAF
ncbi:LysR family transcriptional regulator [Carnobacterium sp.]|uniref:LysR family transcriptional regulator n=1 Tax=Carnobacterium sp. TaxID=48221 RepID=UPI0028AEFAA3|nr:LysR family transcriptional regulator [Carnobacterium sp.]